VASKVKADRLAAAREALAAAWLERRARIERAQALRIDAMKRALEALAGTWRGALLRAEERQRESRPSLAQALDRHARGLAALLQQRSQRRLEERADRARRVAANLGAMASVFSDNLEKIHREYLDRIDRSKLRPMDPLDLQWNVFRLFHKQSSEVYWSRWLTNLLRPEHGARCAGLVWRSFCSAVAASGEAVPHAPAAGEAVPSGRLARSRDWLSASTQQPGEIHGEYHVTGLGAVDVVVSTSSVLAVIENKLWEGWHDWKPAPGELSRQADRYRQLGLNRLQEGQRLGLVVITASDEDSPFTRAVPPDWICVRWEAIGVALRRELRLELEGAGDARQVLELWPALLTLVSIEQDIMGLELPGSSSPFTALKRLTRISRYLSRGGGYARGTVV
jgi:hypothetical protein